MLLCYVQVNINNYNIWQINWIPTFVYIFCVLLHGDSYRWNSFSGTHIDTVYRHPAPRIVGPSDGHNNTAVHHDRTDCLPHQWRTHIHKHDPHHHPDHCTVSRWLPRCNRHHEYMSHRCLTLLQKNCWCFHTT